MYVLLVGTKKNAGDFFIAHAAKRLVSQFTPSKRFLELPSWKPLGDRLEEVNASLALVLCGGPAFQAGLGRTIYPLTEELPRIKVPILSLGLGWKGIPGDEFDVQYYSLPDHATPILERLRDDHPYLSCRDYLTCRMLETKGIGNALMTGCPTWYDPDFLGRGPTLVQEPKNVVFTPAERPEFCDQSIRVLRRVRAVLSSSRIVVSFHRGWTADEHTTPEQAGNARILQEAAAALGLETRDVSGSSEGIEGYKEFDFHVGYRVHAHYKFLSMRKPSILVTEDGRGRGALEATGSAGIPGWKEGRVFSFAKGWIGNPTALRKLRGGFGSYRLNEGTDWETVAAITSELENGFPQTRRALSTIDAAWDKMRLMLNSFPSLSAENQRL